MFHWFNNLFRPNAHISQPVYYFLHLPKCAGTAVIDSLSRGPKASWVIVSDSPQSKRQANQVLQNAISGKVGEAKNLQLVMGHDVHFRMHEIELLHLRPSFYFSFLRDPIQRYVSHFRYMIHCSSNPAHPLHEFSCEQVGSPKQQLSLDQYLEAKRMPNLMAQYLGAANDSNLDSKRWEFDNQKLWRLAISAIEKLDFIGFQDSLARDLIQLSEQLKRTINVSRSNVTQGATLNLNGDQSKKIQVLNELDCELFQLAKRRSAQQS